MSSRRTRGAVASGRVALETESPLPLLPDPMPWDEVKPLSGKPFFHNVLSPSNVDPRYHMRVPNNLGLELPSDSVASILNYRVASILNYRGKSWDLVYNGQSKQKFFGVTGWRKFAVDNCLKVGDACIFELMESSDKKVIFEVQILRGDIPSEFLENDMMGQSFEVPIVIN